jgi:hypothetical protein
MFSADLMVPDTVGTANLLVERLGLPPMRPTWTDSTLERLVYLRAYHPFSQTAPTLIEIINPSGTGLPASSNQPADRPVRTHATVFVTKTYGDVIERLRANGIRHFDMPDPGDGLARCFLGVDDLRDTRREAYDSESDGGLFVEVISWEGTSLATRGPIPPETKEGGITRVVARSYLVPDLDSTLTSLRNALDWPPPDLPLAETKSVRYAILQPEMEESAALELIQPKSGSAEAGSDRYGAFFAAWGVGPHAIRFGVHGLEAKAEDLRQRGTGFAFDETPGGDRVILVDAAALDGTIVEFVEDTLG